MQNNPFADLIPQNQAAPQLTPIVPPDPAKREERNLGITKTQGDIARQPAQAEGDKLANTEKRDNLAYKPMERAGQLRQEFSALPAVKNYSVALGEFGKMMRAPNDPQGDLAVIYAFAKVMDPGSVVREGEMDMATATASLPQQLRAWADRASKGKGLPAEVRKGLIETARNAVGGFNQSYSLKRKEYADLARRIGADPVVVLGNHAGDAFRPQEEALLGRNVFGQEDAASSSRPAYGDISFNQEAKPDPLKPEQEAAYDAFFKINPNPTSDQLRAFGQSIGVTINNADEIIKAKREGAGIKPGSSAIYKAPDISETRKGDERLDPLLRGVADTVTLGFSEELAAVPRALSTGTSYGEALNYENAVRDYDKENNFGLRLGGQLGGGLALPTFGANTVRGLAGVGAGYGGAYGAGSTDGGIGHRAFGAGMGAAAGGAVGGALGAAVPMALRGAGAVGRRMVGPPSQRQGALLQAADQEGVPINAADVFPGSRNTVAALETIPGAAGPIQRGIEAGRDAIEGRVQQLGRGGTARENMGDVVQGAGTRYIERSRQQADRLYERARNQSRDVTIAPQTTMQALMGLVRQEAQVPGGTRAGAVIRRYADAFEQGGPITIDGARAMRSELLSRLRDEGGLTRNQAQRITGQIMGAVNQDIERSLAQAGRNGAVQAYRNADRFYAERMDEIENVIQKFLGTEQNPKSPEQALQVMRSMANPKGDVGRMTRMLSHLTPDERRDFAATLVEPLGRRSADEPFSPAVFIQNVRSISPAARRVIFGTDGERSIQNLVRLSNAKKETVGRLNNSRSGQVSNYRTMISTIVAGLPGGGAVLGMATGLNGATGALGGAAIGAAGVGVSRGIARALMNEEFTRLLAQAPATANPRAINNHIGRLRALGAKDPNVRSVVEQLEQQLIRAANDNVNAVTRGAASSDGTNPERN